MNLLPNAGTRCRVIVLIAGLLLAALPLRAQNFREAMVNMRQRYAQSRQFHIRMDIQAHEAGAAASPFYRQQVQIFRDGDNYLYQLDDQDMLMNEEHFLMVNKASREIVCRPRNKRDEAELRARTGLNLDSLLALNGTPEYLGEQNGLQHYRFREKKGEIDQIDLYFSTADGLVRELAYHYRAGQSARIRFTRFDMQPAFGPGVFDEKRYVVAAQGKYKGAGGFGNYRVHQ
jgi:hypothetical protein